METMSAAEMPVEAAAMEAAAVKAQMMAEAAANEAAAEAVAVETMAAVEMTAGGGNLHGYGYAERASQHAGLKWQRCALSSKALWSRRRRRFRARRPAALCVLKLVVRAQELTSKQVRSAHIHEGVEGAILCAARACQRSASANRGGECLALVVGSGWRATAGRTSPKAIQITIKWTD